MSIPKLINFFMFWIPRKNNVNTKISQLYVNIKTNQFAPCFKFQRKTYQYQNQLIFPIFFGFQESKKKYINTKTNQFLLFFGFQELKKKHINTKITKTNQWVSQLDYIYWTQIIESLFQYLSPSHYPSIEKRIYQDQNQLMFPFF